MNKRFAMYVGIGLVLIACGVFAIISGDNGAHLELRGEILKARTGALGDQNSVAVLDLRVKNPSDKEFVVREVKVTLEKPDGNIEGFIVSKTDMKQLFDYNRFLGEQYNDALSMQDRIPPHGTVDRMVAARFEVPVNVMQKAKAIRLWVQDVHGTEFETVYKLT